MFCQSILSKIVGPTTDLKSHKKLFLTCHMTLKPSIRSSLSKIGSKNSLLGKLLMDYTSSVPPPPLILLLGLLMFRTVAQVQAATQYKQKLKYLLKQLLT